MTKISIFSHQLTAFKRTFPYLLR